MLELGGKKFQRDGSTHFVKQAIACQLR